MFRRRLCSTALFRPCVLTGYFEFAFHGLHILRIDFQCCSHVEDQHTPVREVDLNTPSAVFLNNNLLDESNGFADSFFELNRCPTEPRLSSHYPAFHSKSHELFLRVHFYVAIGKASSGVQQRNGVGLY
ncbi:hypothetical protein [Edaphobacter dinghuensis]|uniref:hypothetical protein n=1 Tax=Edaphobacter dinghuensis TaxID=1560005 RepID=UPI0016653758|nr:hypothetical protein [Edaphobacter dinghuensis]